LFPDDMRAGEGRMTAEIDLDGGRKPAELEVATVIEQEGGFGQIEFARDLVLERIIDSVGEQADAGRIAGEEPVGETIDGEDGLFHFSLDVGWNPLVPPAAFQRAALQRGNHGIAKSQPRREV